LTSSAGKTSLNSVRSLPDKSPRLSSALVSRILGAPLRFVAVMFWPG